MRHILKPPLRDYYLAEMQRKNEALYQKVVPTENHPSFHKPFYPSTEYSYHRPMPYVNYYPPQYYSSFPPVDNQVYYQPLPASTINLPKTTATYYKEVSPNFPGSPIAQDAEVRPTKTLSFEEKMALSGIIKKKGVEEKPKENDTTVTTDPRIRNKQKAS